ncbi:MAG: TOBE domain-containing protein, partial [Planctomycetales bacterium]|nr:TOBE domain-containing protein [Planctomycetales bacterium]
EWSREAPGPCPPEGAAYVGFRPESIGWGDGGVLTWQATLVQVACLGFDTVVEMQWQGEREGEFLSCKARHAGKPRHQAGETVQCQVAASDLHWFDEATRRITT